MTTPHPRDAAVWEAELDLNGRVVDWFGNHLGLTRGEHCRVLGRVLGSQVSSLAGFMIRDERHPDDP